MTVKVTFKLNRAALEDILKSDEVRADLQRRADAVKSAVGSSFNEHVHYGYPPEIIADTYVGRSRAGATVIAIHPEALEIEREHRILGGAIDAARG